MEVVNDLLLVGDSVVAAAHERILAVKGHASAGRASSRFQESRRFDTRKSSTCHMHNRSVFRSQMQIKSQNSGLRAVQFEGNSPGTGDTGQDDFTVRNRKAYSKW
jgi:hypothetical protein